MEEVDAGGYVYLSLLNFFKYPPDPAYDDSGEANRLMFLQRGQRKLDDEFKPTARLAGMVDEALMWEEDRAVFGDPYPGGANSQPIAWKIAVVCVERARQAADWERRREDARNQEDK